ncbi:MAG: 2-C-methyl-D-erythritol 4-phosphate cytidylyltransferase [Gammaproteobacteria bacterium]|nr:2-C-methyl-D-erythritol 4-phosphate cytidylyltransferase [Gammaproteobacteria bacterium]
MAAAQCWGAIPAAGIGSRFAAGRPKQYLRIRGRSVLEHALRPFLGHPAIRGIVVALAEGDPWWEELPAEVRKSVTVIDGGAERIHSVRNCLRHLLTVGDPDDWVLVHDAARPCLRREDLDLLLSKVASHAVGGILALPVRDTMKRADRCGDIAATVDRAGLWHALTPQMFRLRALDRALSAALAAGTPVTDEAQAMELAGTPGMLVQGHADNIKVTLNDDLAMAELLLSRRTE